jgi:hypothetical protein
MSDVGSRVVHGTDVRRKTATASGCQER